MRYSLATHQKRLYDPTPKEKLYTIITILLLCQLERLFWSRLHIYHLIPFRPRHTEQNQAHLGQRVPSLLIHDFTHEKALYLLISDLSDFFVYKTTFGEQQILFGRNIYHAGYWYQALERSNTFLAHNVWKT
jgi:hypothetical protein